MILNLIIQILRRIIGIVIHPMSYNSCAFYNTSVAKCTNDIEFFLMSKNLKFGALLGLLLSALK